MNELQRKRFENLLARAQKPEFDLVARELVARAFGWIEGLLEGDVITPEDYSGLFREIALVEALIYDRSRARPRLAS
jgi:hypothetical protein